MIILIFSLQKAMEDLGLSADEIHDVFSLVGAVLKLGNITFVPTTNMDGTEGCVISNDYGKSCRQKELVIYDVTIFFKTFNYLFSLLATKQWCTPI